MAVAALLDLGADEEALMRGLKSLSVSGFETKISRVKKAGIDACDFQVILDKEHENHDHDMEYLHGHHHHHEHEEEHAHHHHHGHEEEHGHHHHHGHEEEHSHHHHEHEEEHSHHHHHDHGEGHTHHHEHRGLPEIIEILNHADMTERARELAVQIFRIIGEAEAKAHGLPIEEVHFHEVGAVDSIADIAAFAICFDSLDIEQVVIPELYEGRGFVRCQHGVLPIPVPAVNHIVQAEGLTLHMTDTEGEFVTPTGAAIAAAVRTTEQLPKKFRICRTGIGAGKRTYERPSLLRAMLIEEISGERDVIVKLESNIDDCTGENLGYVMERLMEAGARDVNYMPVYMKKNRPAYQLNVICSEEDVERMEEIIFRDTTTIGIRRVTMERTILKREKDMCRTSFGEVQVKICDGPDGKRVYPEYESIAAIARETGIGYPKVYEKVLREITE